MAEAENTVKTDDTDNSTNGPLAFKTAKDKVAEREVLFTIDDVPYDVPTKPGMRVVMRYLNVARKTGNDLYAAQQLVEDMLGEDKWADFLDWPDLDDETMNKVISRCVDLAVSSVEDDTKN